MCYLSMLACRAALIATLALGAASPAGAGCSADQRQAIENFHGYLGMAEAYVERCNYRLSAWAVEQRDLMAKAARTCGSGTTAKAKAARAEYYGSILGQIESTSQDAVCTSIAAIIQQGLDDIFPRMLDQP